MFALIAAFASVPISIDSQWRLSERRDPITGVAQVWAVVGSQQRHVAIGCETAASGELQLIFRFGKYLGSESRGLLMGGRPIAVRFDENAPMSWRANYEDDGITETKPDLIRRFVENAKASRRLVVRAQDYEFNEVDLIIRYGADPGPTIERAIRHCVPVNLPRN